MKTIVVPGIRREKIYMFTCFDCGCIYEDSDPDKTETGKLLSVCPICGECLDEVEIRTRSTLLGKTGDTYDA